MTVAEFIAELQKARQDAPVVMCDPDTGWFFLDVSVLVDGQDPVMLSAKEDYAGPYVHDWDEVMEHFK